VTVAVGLDVGATKLAGARVDVERGVVLAERRRPTLPQRGPAAVLADCKALAAELAAGVAVAAVGLAVCELVDPAGRVRSAETVDWRGVDLVGALADVAPGRVESDVRAAALAEARHGAGRAEPDFLYVSVGSGISHCLMVDGRPRLGVRGSALGTGAPLVERWSGGHALARRTGHASAQAALADPACAAIVEDAARRLGLVLAALVNALDPGALVIGGGLGLDDGYRGRVVEGDAPGHLRHRRARASGAARGPR
jgi:glucokinase